jgi:hypothetical protein
VLCWGGKKKKVRSPARWIRRFDKAFGSGGLIRRSPSVWIRHYPIVSAAVASERARDTPPPCAESCGAVQIRDMSLRPPSCISTCSQCVTAGNGSNGSNFSPTPRPKASSPPKWLQVLIDHPRRAAGARPRGPGRGLAPPLLVAVAVLGAIGVRR